MSAMNAYRSRLSAKYWNRLPLATPARRAMTFRLPPEKPCAPNSASAASITAARRAGSTRAQVTVGIRPPPLDDHWSFYCEPAHSSRAIGRRLHQQIEAEGRFVTHTSRVLIEARKPG